MRSTAFLAGTLLVGVSLSADVAFNQADADSFQRKLLLITRNAQARPPAPRETPVREGEVNAYMRYHLKDTLPAGVMDPYVSIVGEGRVAGRATVDLDVLRERRSSGGWLDPRSYLTGRLPVTARGVLHSKDGFARLQVDAVEVSGVPMPVSLLAELVSYYSRTPDRPEGVSLDDPMPLPAHIREIRVGRGEAIVVQ
jgi:hypothetical protein